MARDDPTCLLCGEPIARTAIDPCSAVLSAHRPDRAPGEPGGRRHRSAAAWWRRPPGQYWVHAACLRRAAHPSVPLEFLDAAEGESP